MLLCNGEGPEEGKEGKGTPYMPVSTGSHDFKIKFNAFISNESRSYRVTKVPASPSLLLGERTTAFADASTASLTNSRNGQPPLNFINPYAFHLTSINIERMSALK